MPPAVKYPGSMEHRAPEHNLRLRRWEHNSSVPKARLENNFAQGDEGAFEEQFERAQLAKARPENNFAHGAKDAFGELPKNF